MGLPLRGRAVMNETTATGPTSALIRSLPTLPKERLVSLWEENFGKTRAKSAQS